MLSVDELRSMQADAIDFGSHTQTHCALPDVPIEAATEEVEQSRATLERILEKPVTTFAYPYGMLDDRVLGIVRGRV